MSLSKIVGIVNITPDSFSDGGKAFAPKDAIAHCQSLVEQGADVLDLGAESTRPDATPLSHEEEWGRLAPVLEHICAAGWLGDVTISIDTRHPKTAEKALHMGAHIINDVSGLSNPDMLNVLAAHDCPIIVMHALSIPASKTELLPENTDMPALMRDWQKATAEKAGAAGIHPSRLIFDPGLGFGKSAAQSWQLLTRVSDYASTPKNWLIGHSKKSMFALCSDEVSLRAELTLCASAFLYGAGVGYLRVHDVAKHVALRDSIA